MLNKKIVIALIITLSISSFIHASFVAMTEKEKLIYIDELKKKKASEIEQKLTSVMDEQFGLMKVSFIIKELGNRADKQSQVILEKYSEKLKNDMKISPVLSKPYNEIQINLAKIKAGGQDSEKFINELEKLLISGDQSLQNEAANMLSKTMRPEARKLLTKYENQSNIKDNIRFYRLRMDYLNLSDEDFIKVILKSAREQATIGDTRLSVERSLLSDRMSRPISSALLQEEIQKPTIDNQAYKEFLKEYFERIQKNEKTSFLGFSELWERYEKRDSGILSELEKIYLDDTYTKYSANYREKVYEMYLTIKLEQDDLKKSQEAAIFLLSQLTGTGDGHLSDYTEKGQKTLQAIKNTAITTLLIRLGDEALPVINEEMNKDNYGLNINIENSSKEALEQRKEALDYLKKRIEITKELNKVKL